MASEQAQLAAWKVRKTGYSVNISRSTSRAFTSVAGDRCPRRPDKPPPVYGSNLVEHDKADLFLKTTRNPEGVGMPAGRHGSDHKGTQRVVQFTRRNYRTRPHFLYFLALCWIQRNEVNVPTPGINHSQTHSDASNADRCGASSSPSSPLP